MLSGWALHLGQNSGANGIVNLLGGTVTTTAVGKGGGNGALNFNGGTLKASVANSGFFGGLNNTYIYGGGATIDDGGFPITIAQPLLAPTGYGIGSIPVSAGGAGYIDTPVVTLTGGSGSGATAIAQIDNSLGAVTNILITNPGNGYTNTDTLIVAFSGSVTATDWPTRRLSVRPASASVTVTIGLFI